MKTRSVCSLFFSIRIWTHPCLQSSALQLSAALLRAILVNHVSHSEATKAAKNMELAMKGDLEELEAVNEKLDSELRR
jgi:hypothetical protein